MGPSHHLGRQIPRSVCRSCSLKIGLQTTAKRRISQTFLKKTINAELEWKDQAEQIKNGTRKSMLTVLEERGFINQIAGSRNELDDLMIRKRIGAYVGVDPTAASLHVGHLVPFMALFWMYIHGFHAVTLLGGATAKIGDPTDRTTSRERQHRRVMKENMEAMHEQLSNIWSNVESAAQRHGYAKTAFWKRALVNNNAWLNKTTIMEILQVAGPGFRLGPMLSRDTVKNKLEKGDGMSFAEFSYPLLQAWDWWTMYTRNDIQLQIGGSDQFGNIITGIDAVKYISRTHHDPHIRQNTEKEDSLRTPYGFTTPLLTTAAGDKFGKSAGNAIWLNREMTSIFDLYGFFIGTPDADVERYLKLFTFLPLSAITEIIEKHTPAPEHRIAQHILAREFVALVHGVREAENAAREHATLFAKQGISLAEIIKGAENTDFIGRRINEPIPLPRSLVIGKSFARILAAAGLVESIAKGQRLVASQGAYVGRRGEKDPTELVFEKIGETGEDVERYLIEGGLLVLRVGKRNVRVVKVVDDDVFEEQGLTPLAGRLVMEEKDGDKPEGPG